MLRRACIMLSCLSLRTLLLLAFGLTLLLPNTSQLVKASVLDRNGDTNREADSNFPHESNQNRNLGANPINNNNNRNNNNQDLIYNKNNQGQERHEQAQGQVNGDHIRNAEGLYAGSQNQLKALKPQPKSKLGVDSVQIPIGAGVPHGAGTGVTGARPGERDRGAGQGVRAQRGELNDQEKQNIGLGPPPVGLGKVQEHAQEGDLQTLDGTHKEIVVKGKKKLSETQLQAILKSAFNHNHRRKEYMNHTPPPNSPYAPLMFSRENLKSGKPFHPTVAYTLFNASNIKNGNNQDEQKIRDMELAREHKRLRNRQQLRDGQKSRNRKIRKPGVTAPPAKPSGDMKKHVSWFEGSRTYAFRASPDTRLLIRHAPIPAQGSPWPLPQHYYPEDSVFTLSPDNFQFHAIGEMCDILDFQFERIRRNTFGDDLDKEEGGAGGGGGAADGTDNTYKEIRYINVTVLKECPKYPSLNIDESYDLEIKWSGASIIAREIWGAVRALETFSQLIYQDDVGRYLINRTLINDFPRFPHRGILLDTARHYLSKETIINNLEAMAQNKMNVFHWHIVDDQSFPFESKTFPNLTKHGAYDSRTHIYTHETIAEIIEEARLRGIRVIPEFDTPGHTLSWGFGQDYLLTPCYDYNRQPNGQFGPINPILKSTYLFLQKLFREVLAVFKEKYVHLGGDEVPFDCWESNPQINNFIKRNNLTDIRDVLGLYERKLLEIVSQLGKTRDVGSGYIVWQEVVDNGVNVKPDTIVHVWMGDAFDIERIINMGLRVVYSTCWYLDYISYGQDWDKYYRCEQLEQLQEFQLKNSSLFLGGEAALWMEYADDENAISRLWPRASAAAERLWSNKRVRDEVAAASRIEEQRCRMLRRGLKVGVLSGPGYCPRWSRHGRPQQTKDAPAFWSSNSDEIRLRSNYPQVYVVDMNAMYLVPVLIVICICCLTLITLAQDSKSKIVAILSYPVGGTSRKGVKGLLYIFMAFAFAWCIWTAPIWMNSWETSANKARPVAPNSKLGGY